MLCNELTEIVLVALLIIISMELLTSTLIYTLFTLYLFYFPYCMYLLSLNRC